MATRSINFVREHRRQLKFLIEKDRQVLKLVGIGFGVLVILLVASLAINWNMNRQLTNLVSKQESTRQTINSQADLELKYLTFVAKLNVLTGLFANRQGKQEALAFFRSLFDDDVKIAGLKYDDKDQQLMFSIRSKSIFSLDQVFNVLKSDQVAKQYPLIDKKGLSRSNDGSYSLQAIVQLDKKEIKP
ncbi:MAG: hypothetical protein ABIJ03_02475 [Patescibacteria group bacterium]|nr:hypothetical protein [Patescibacteria group bacterium]